MRDLLEKEKAAFHTQRHTAMKRGIVFKLTFDEWHNWWIEQLGPDWREKRGRTAGKYCMARFGDKGPYSLQNIKCITVEANHSEGHRPTTLVADIYQAKGCLVNIAKRFGVLKSKVFDIRRGRSWPKVTAKLRYGGNCNCPRIGVNKRKCPFG